MPKDYPNSNVPDITIEIEKGLTKKQCETVTEIAKTIAAENIGNPSVFTIAEGVKDWLINNNVPGQDGSMYADMMRRMQQKETEVKKKIVKEELIKSNMLANNSDENSEVAIDKEELERLRKRALGTLVTPESFVLWKKKFDEEMKADMISNPTRPSGSYCPVNATLVTPTTVFSHSKMIFNFAIEPPIIIPSSDAATSASAQDTANIIQARPTGKQLFIMNKAIGNYSYLEENNALLEEGLEKALDELALVDQECEEEEEDEDYSEDDEEDEDDDEEDEGEEDV